MNILIMFIMMITIGALIGGITNSLAIKMLFRPYYPLYIGNWKLPFTPGLIPKRKDQLAQQLGDMVVQHLLTEESIRRKLADKTVKVKLTELVKKETEKRLETENTLREVLLMINSSIKEDAIRRFIQEQGTTAFQKWLVVNKDKQIGFLVNEKLQIDVETYELNIVHYLQTSLVKYLKSEESKAHIQYMLRENLNAKGMFGSMLSSFFSGEGFIEKVQQTIIRYTQSEKAHLWLRTIIHNEWETYSNQTVQEVVEQIGQEKMEMKWNRLIQHNLDLNNLLDQPVKKLFAPIQMMLLNTVTNAVVPLIEWFQSRLGGIMKGLNLEKLIAEEVQSFPLKRVEELVLAISKKEFRMITYLGAFLGGIIGFIQGIIIVLVG
ncbi:hypothetical protein BN1058_01345 [Paraliobacillus sp. PM-2]|uniref:DUF445 domain-containing protein n=1 Tax=Paraliobacillus sp. PM-2 TaxID=1462524 RepID=UPI00061CD21A|nr:DUF445 family protein [Paraliobacillus sp. PM-2]CQR47056.1 hypothetical protein BN1058_01345 [Paraliobacillus sp. PM-2]